MRTSVVDLRVRLSRYKDSAFPGLIPLAFSTAWPQYRGDLGHLEPGRQGVPEDSRSWPACTGF